MTKKSFENIWWSCFWLIELKSVVISCQKHGKVRLLFNNDMMRLICEIIQNLNKALPWKLCNILWRKVWLITLKKFLANKELLKSIIEQAFIVRTSIASRRGLCLNFLLPLAASEGYLGTGGKKRIMHWYQGL